MKIRIRRFRLDIGFWCGWWFRICRGIWRFFGFYRDSSIEVVWWGRIVVIVDEVVVWKRISGEGWYGNGCGGS